MWRPRLRLTPRPVEMRSLLRSPGRWRRSEQLHQRRQKPGQRLAGAGRRDQQRGAVVAGLLQADPADARGATSRGRRTSAGKLRAAEGARGGLVQLISPPQVRPDGPGRSSQKLNSFQYLTVTLWRRFRCSCSLQGTDRVRRARIGCPPGIAIRDSIVKRLLAATAFLCCGGECPGGRPRRQGALSQGAGRAWSTTGPAFTSA